MLVLITVAVLIELNTHFAERLTGYYLNWRNIDREAWGTYWEKETLTREVTKRVEEETAEARKLRRQADLVKDFPELIALLSQGTGVSITPEKFVQLFRTIPAPLRPLLISPRDLVELYWSDTWVRTSIWVKEGGCVAYLIDGHNRMIRDISITRSILKAASDYGRTRPGTVSAIMDFSGNVFSGSKFLRIFTRMPQSERYGLFTDPDILLAIPKPLIQVGLSPSKDRNGIGSIGFESRNDEGEFVLIFPASDLGINRLLWLLAWEESETLFAPGSLSNTHSPHSPSRTGGNIH